jgi:hypothetical protein
MEQSPWEDDSHLASQEIPRLFTEPGPATDLYPEPDESRPHLPSYSLKIRSNIIFPSTHRSSE